LKILFVLFLWTKGASAQPVDFSQYTPGKNNRALYERIISELATEFEVPVRTAYRKGLQATPHQIIIDEVQLDAYIREVESIKDKEAVARFILAHEYFHIFLKHPQALDSVRVPKEIQIKGSYGDTRKAMERQVDYLAAKHITQLGLPIEPIRQMFLRHPEFHGGNEYPSARERAEIVSSVSKKDFAETYFDNEVIQCTALLGRLRLKFR